MSRKIAALVLAAGKGTRMKSDRAKVLHPVAWRPMLSHVLDAAAAIGAARRIVVVGHGASAVRAACAGDSSLEFVEQTEQRGTGHAVQCAKAALAGFDGVVLVLYGDVPLIRAETLRALLAHHESAAAPISVLTTRPADATGYGRVVRDPDTADRIKKIVEHKDATPKEREIGEINSGILAADTRFLFDAVGQLEAKNAQKELYLTDVIGIAAARRSPASAFAHDPAFELEGVNDRAQLAQAERRLFERTAAALMASGVTILDPTSTRIDPRARVAPDAVIHPQVEIRGATVVGGESVIETGTVIDECVIGSKVHVKPYCVFTKARVADACILGPFAHLRPDADLADGVHVGNFVEVKKTTLGRGSKANHLAYLGDATIGSGVNVGAGTITCNYDGYEKHRTEIADGVFIGSDTQLVAPVKVGKDAVIGAGATITKDVPEGALALTRAEMKIVPGYAARRRERAKRASSNESATRSKSAKGKG